jgi:hypothetical protein
MYLALDQSPRLIGWAMGVPGGQVRTGRVKLPDKDKNSPEYMVEAQRWLKRVIEREGVECVCTESVFFGDNAATYAKGAKLVGAIELECFKHGVRCFEVEPDTWRKRFIGFCRAPRGLQPYSARKRHLTDAAQRACAERGWYPETPDEAEACGILEWIWACNFPDYAAWGGTPLLDAGMPR